MKMKAFRFSFLPALAMGLLYLTWLGQVRGEGPSAMSQRTFASPAEATDALVKAAKAHDRHAIDRIFGPEVTNLMTGDGALDERHFESFANDVATRCDVITKGNNKVILEIGQNPWPFPIPLIKTNGAWHFDTVAGEEEIVNRHIGRDEYYAIGVCRAYVKAQRDYAARLAKSTGTLKYAERFRSTPGTMDGLCWQAETGGKSSLLSSYVAEACMEKNNGTSGNSRPRPFHGYVFKILKRQGPAAPGGKRDYVSHGEMTGGFALIAYPVRWGQSGIMTFVVNQDGIVYQRSFGENTARTAAGMKEYNPDKSWTVVQEEGITDLTTVQPAENAR
jgi:hypothetical protein